MEKFIIIVEGGIVQDVKGLPEGTEYEVHDYDTEGADASAEVIEEDDKGREYVRIDHTA